MTNMINKIFRGNSLLIRPLIDGDKKLMSLSTVYTHAQKNDYFHYFSYKFCFVD